MNHKKIAELAHVSASTVSKALSGSSEVNEETAKRIRKIAIDGGYFKEKSKRKREYTNNSSILVSILVPEILGHHYSTVITCMKNRIEEKGGTAAIYIYDFDNDKCNNILESIILHGRTDGVIMFRVPQLPVKTNIPIVCSSSYYVNEYDSVGHDIHAIMRDSVKFLKNLGHQKIGFIGEYNTICSFEAFKEALTENELSFCQDYIYIVNGRFEAIGIQAAKELINSRKRPTAIITAYDEIAHSLIFELTKNNISVPDEISVMGINNVSSSQYAQIPLTTVDTFSEEQYKMAVDILFDKIMNETAAIRHITVEHQIIERETTKKIEE